jgi:Zn-dependent M28 family amino/carboxypeptidase
MKVFYKSLTLSLLISFSINSQESNKESIKKDIEYLASEELEGRFPGTNGEDLAANYIAEKFEKFGLTKLTGSYFQDFNFTLPSSPHEEVKFNEETNSKIDTKNIIAFIDNNKKNTVIIGAHYDHIGYGGQYSLDRGVNEIHNGADDNASGTAMLISLAKQLKNRNDLKNNYLFIAFSAEELGLIGSRYFVNSEIFDSESINFMINLDMVGRLNEERELSIYGVGTSSIFKQVVNSLNNNFKLKIINDGTGPSDHTSFYNKDIPVLFFNTGSHENYHRPSDDVDLINYEGISEISNYVIDIIDELETYNKLEFKETISNQTTVSRFNVSLRVMPDYVFEGEGMKADQIIKGGPADEAGLIDGDVIIMVGEYEVKDVYDYMNSLSKFEEGDITKVFVLRGDKKLEFIVKF